MIKLRLFRGVNLLMELYSPVVPMIGSVMSTSRGRYMTDEVEYIFSYDKDKLVQVAIQATKLGE